MAIVRTIAVIANKGLTDCWAYVLAYEEGLDWDTVELGADDRVQVVGGHCGNTPTRQLGQSGICADHLPQLSPRMQSQARPLGPPPQQGCN